MGDRLRALIERHNDVQKNLSILTEALAHECLISQAEVQEFRIILDYKKPQNPIIRDFGT